MGEDQEQNYADSHTIVVIISYTLHCPYMYTHVHTCRREPTSPGNVYVHVLLFLSYTNTCSYTEIDSILFPTCTTRPVCYAGRMRRKPILWGLCPFQHPLVLHSDVQVCHQRKDTTLVVFDLILSPTLNLALSPSPSPMNIVIS